MKAVAAVFVGAGVGALLRWWFSTLLNHLVPALPPGTLLANLLGGYIIGVAMAITALGVNWSPEWRLLVVTGFCGGLTTFSTFSAEIVSLLQVGRLSSALIAAAVHLAGSILMTLVGVATVSWWRSA